MNDSKNNQKINAIDPIINNNRVKLNITRGIAHVELARPKKHNALDLLMFESIVKTIKVLRRDRSIRVVVVSAQGTDFCTGLDVKSVMGSSNGPLKLLFKWWPWGSNLAQKVSTDWQKIAAPVIMVINGRCWGGGLQIALGADIRIAHPQSSLSILEGRWGLIPDMGGTLALRENCRIDVAKELAMTARFVDGQEAQQLGLVTSLSEEPLKAAQQLADDIIKQSPDSIAGVKRLYNKSWYSGKAMILLRESFYQLRVMTGKNMRIKSHNQTHDEEQHKKFVDRKKW